MLGLLAKQQAGRLSDEAALHASVRQAVAEAVRQQAEAGLDVINDGEQGRVDYTVFVKDLLTGFEGESTPPIGTGDDEFPELTALLQPHASPFQNRPACSGPVAWKDWAGVERDLNNLRAATTDVEPEAVFMTSPSPGQIARFLHNRYYPSEEEYLYALADVMKRAYRAIVDAGFLLQLDCPDLALSRHTVFAHLTLEEFLEIIQMHVQVLNYAVADISPEQMRIHLCWGSTLGPHHTDVPLKDILNVVLQARPAALSFPGANPRHEHEWKIWKDLKLPPGKIIIPGVIDSTSNFVEHPELVAERLIKYAGLVGRENVIAGMDCGLGTRVGHPKICWAKFQAMAEGAQIASKQLWPRAS